MPDTDVASRTLAALDTTTADLLAAAALTRQLTAAHASQFAMRLVGIEAAAAQLRRWCEAASAARFTLDETRAARWLARATRQAGGGSALDGPGRHDSHLPHIGAGWQPALDRHSGPVAELIHLARDTGIITRPAAWNIGYEYATGPDGPGYRWLLVSSDESLPLILADAFSDSWPDSAGAEAALDLLRDAVTAGNELLADLERYAAAARLAPAGLAAPGQLAQCSYCGAEVAPEDGTDFWVTGEDAAGARRHCTDSPDRLHHPG
jgi:hypothetical protein